MIKITSSALCQIRNILKRYSYNYIKFSVNGGGMKNQIKIIKIIKIKIIIVYFSIVFLRSSPYLLIPELL